jgi:hypothetical protein
MTWLTVITILFLIAVLASALDERPNRLANRLRSQIEGEP